MEAACRALTLCWTPAALSFPGKTKEERTATRDLMDTLLSPSIDHTLCVEVVFSQIKILSRGNFLQTEHLSYKQTQTKCDSVLTAEALSPPVDWRWSAACTRRHWYRALNASSRAAAAGCSSHSPSSSIATSSSAFFSVNSKSQTSSTQAEGSHSNQPGAKKKINTNTSHFRLLQSFKHTAVPHDNKDILLWKNNNNSNSSSN